MNRNSGLVPNSARAQKAVVSQRKLKNVKFPTIHRLLTAFERLSCLVRGRKGTSSGMNYFDFYNGCSTKWYELFRLLQCVQCCTTSYARPPLAVDPGFLPMSEVSRPVRPPAAATAVAARRYLETMLWVVLHCFFLARSAGRAAVALLEPRRGLTCAGRKLQRLLVGPILEYERPPPSPVHPPFVGQKIKYPSDRSTA